MKNKGFPLIQEFERTGKQVFTVADARFYLKGSRASVMAILMRLRQKRLIVSLANGLYVILHPTEQDHGVRPLRIIDPLMKFLGTDYYVGLLSAANHWGAAHHKPQCVQVITSRRHFLKRLQDLKMEFHLRKDFAKKGIVLAKSFFGYHQISSPELTALDVISFQPACGGFDNVCLVVRDLAERMREKSLLECCKEYGIMSSIQRLGYMLEKYKAPKKLIHPLKKWILLENRAPAPLFAGGERKGPVNKDWNVIENASLEFEE